MVNLTRRGLLSALLCIVLLPTLLNRAGAQFNVPSLRMYMSGSHEVVVVVTPTNVLVNSDTKCDVLVHLLGKDMRSTWTVPAGNRLLERREVFDLAANKVPRFTENQQMLITVTMTNKTTSAKVVQTGIVFLPVVMVPGIFNGDGGDGTWPKLEKYLISQANGILSSLKMLGEPYQLWNPNSPTSYPTLNTLNYGTSKESFTTSGDKLNARILWLLSKTYADRVIIVTHSKGGLVARSYLTRYVNPRQVARVVMCLCPNLGSIDATTGNLLPGTDLQNLYPLWDWYRSGRGRPFAQTPNPELTTLNQWPLPNGINYYVVYSSGVRTLLTAIDNGGLNPTYGYWGGDGVVPDFSQVGQIMDTNAGNSLGRIIPAFDAAYKAGFLTYWRIDGAHSGYVEDNATAQNFIWNRVLYPVNPP